MTVERGVARAGGSRGYTVARVWGAHGAPSARSSILHGDRDQPVAPLSLVLSLVNHGLNRTRVIRSSFNRKQFNLGRESKSVTSKQEILHAEVEPRAISAPPEGMGLEGWRQERWIGGVVVERSRVTLAV